jgi:hypothetical protein
MKEDKIIAFIAVWSCLILANINKDETLHGWFWIGLAIIWLIRYVYLKWND